MPILILDGLDIEPNDAFGDAGNDQPVLRVVAQVAGHWEAHQ